MRAPRSVSLVLVFLGLYLLGLWLFPVSANIIPAIVPQAVPVANKQGNGTLFQLGAGGFVSGHLLQYDVNGNAVDGGTTAGTVSAPFYAYMTNISYPAAYAISMGAGDTDLYTVPVGRKAYVIDLMTTNGTAGPINEYPEVKLGGSYYPIFQQNTNNAHTYGSNTGCGIIVLSAGEKASIHTNGAGLSAWFKITEFDDSSPLKRADIKSFSPGDNVLYTVPVGKTVEFQNGRTSITPLSAQYKYLNFSGAPRTINVYHVPFGGSPSTANQTDTATVADTTFRFDLVYSLLPGDFLDVNVDAGTATQYCWVNYIER